MHDTIGEIKERTRSFYATLSRDMKLLSHRHTQQAPSVDDTVWLNTVAGWLSEYVLRLNAINELVSPLVLEANDESQRVIDASSLPSPNFTVDEIKQRLESIYTYLARTRTYWATRSEKTVSGLSIAATMTDYAERVKSVIESMSQLKPENQHATVVALPLTPTAWELETARWGSIRLRDLLHYGWEPFAVSGADVSLRRVTSVNTPDPPSP